MVLGYKREQVTHFHLGISSWKTIELSVRKTSFVWPLTSYKVIWINWAFRSIYKLSYPSARTISANEYISFMVKSANHWSPSWINPANYCGKFQIIPANQSARLHNNFPSHCAPFHVKSETQAIFPQVQWTIPIQMHWIPVDTFPTADLDAITHFFHIPCDNFHRTVVHPGHCCSM